MITSREFKALLALLGWDTQTTCNRLCIHSTTLSKYRNGYLKVPSQIIRILALELNRSENFKNHRNPRETIQYILD